MKKIITVLKIVMANPINKKNRFKAFIRFCRWQFGSWLVPGKVLIPWINESRIFAGFMMSGSAGCAYSGLHEFEEMAFILHFLRKEDLFMDIGANVGVFTVLAGSAIGASCISVEPGTEAFAHLLDNISINHMKERVRAVNACVSNENSSCSFSNSQDSTWSHITCSDRENNTTEMETLKIDTVLENKTPSMLKIDVEGFEKQALEGAHKTLGSPQLKAVLLEIGSHSLRYNVKPEEIHAQMIKYGFKPHIYDPFKRCLSLLNSYADSENTIYIRDKDFVAERLRTGPSFIVFGQKI